MSSADNFELQRVPTPAALEAESSNNDDGVSNASLQPLRLLKAKETEPETAEWTDSMDTRRFLAIFALGLCYVGESAIEASRSWR